MTYFQLNGIDQFEMNTTEEYDSDPFKFQPLKRRRFASPPTKKKIKSKKCRKENAVKETSSIPKCKSINPRQTEKTNLTSQPRSPLMTSSRIEPPAEKISAVVTPAPPSKYHHDSPAVRTERQRRFESTKLIKCTSGWAP